ncbi:MAG: carboxypeptidase-like regulatory domain-containing protein, partial [Acidimicrobiales bacterium]
MVAYRVLAVFVLCISGIAAASGAEAQIAGGSVSGHVRTAAGGVVGSVAVDLFGATADGSRGQFLGSTVTGDDGSYEFGDLSAGVYVLTFIANGDDEFTNNRRWLNVAVQVEAGEVVEGV